MQTPLPFKWALCLLLALHLPSVHAQGYFPCHPTKPIYNTDATCTRIDLPPGLCKRCTLRPTDERGRFEVCDRIFDTESTECHDAMKEYVADNGYCDPVRAEALPKMLSGDEEARKVIDYFLYSVCEQCCDCLPMGVEKGDYIALAQAHTSQVSALWAEDRGNCPAHAHFDICKVLPHAHYFAQKGWPAKEDYGRGCKELKFWIRSDESEDWDVNPKTNITPELRNFLRTLLDATECKDFRVWSKCYDMENKQQHLELPAGFVEPETDEEERDPPPPVTEPPTTTTESTTTETTTTETTTTEATTTEATTTETTTTEATTTETTTTEATTTETTTTEATTTEAANTETTTVVADDTTTTTTPSTTDSTEPIGTSIFITPNPSPTEVIIAPTPISTSPPPVTVVEEEQISTGEDGATDTDETDAETVSDSEPTEEDGGSTCFSADMTVELRGGEIIQMRHLRIGDEVRVSHDRYSEVILFTHRVDEVGGGMYVQMETEAGNKTVVMTEGHLIPVNHGNMVSAVNVKVGDEVEEAENGWTRVRSVRKVYASGLYNPQTIDGGIVVNGVVVSTFTKAVDMRIAKVLLWPVQVLYKLGVVNEERFGGMLRHGWNIGMQSSV